MNAIDILWAGRHLPWYSEGLVHMPYKVKPVSAIRTVLRLPGDKSISHRALILSSLATGRTVITNFSFNDDCSATKDLLSSLGVRVSVQGKGKVSVHGAGLCGLRPPDKTLYCSSSGTTARLMLGVLAAQPFVSRLDGSSGLRRRPMDRVTGPLEKMGAVFSSTRLPLTVKGSPLTGLNYLLPVASAQVKSAILLAGLFADKRTVVIEKNPSRDHTERMMRFFGLKLSLCRAYSGRGSKITLLPPGKDFVSSGKITVPGDISSAAFFISAATILPGSCVTIKDVSVNPTRMGFVNVLRRMGASVSIKDTGGKCYFEPFADIQVRSAVLKGTKVRKDEIPSLIDELPVLMVCAAYAGGITEIKGIGELRVKETDRVRSMITNLSAMGARLKVCGDNIVIKGGGGLSGSRIRSYGDHRTAMSMMVAGLRAKGDTYIDEVGCIDKSFPGFANILEKALVR